MTDEKKSRGFAAMDPETRARIAKKGGIEGHRQGVAHKWTTEEAREAGRKGGRASAERRAEHARAAEAHLDALLVEGVGAELARAGGKP